MCTSSYRCTTHKTQREEKRERDERDTKSALFFLGRLSECAYVLCICVYIYVCVCVYTHSACTLYVNEDTKGESKDSTNKP